MKLDPRTSAIVTLVFSGAAYALLISKGQKPPAGLDQLIVAAAATLFVVKDKAVEDEVKKHAK